MTVSYGLPIFSQCLIPITVRCSPLGEAGRKNVTYNSELKATPHGYDVSAVAALIKEIDIEAADNSGNATWKRYVGLGSLSIATGIEKGALVLAVFGPGARPSKAFQNCYSIARKAFNHILDDGGWKQISELPIDLALTATIVAINDDMAVLSVTSKNEYDKVCGRLPAAPNPEEKTSEDRNAAITGPNKSDVDEVEPTSSAVSVDEEAHGSGIRVPRGLDENGVEISTTRIIGALQHAPKADLMLVANRIIEHIELKQLQELRDEIAEKIRILERVERPDFVSAHAA